MSASAENVIAFQGELGANSDMACRDMFAHMQALPCPSFEDAFRAVESGQAKYAMIPIENTLAGRVADIHHLLPQSELKIVGEYFMPIHFQLMALPETQLSDIETVHSHIHALGQCRDVLRQNGWQAKVAGDTAGAARWVRDQNDKTRAALAPKLAAELYGLNILLHDVEDADHNTTRFVILSKDAEEQVAGDEVMTTLAFQVRNIPAALYKALGGFATNGVNMTKLESYQLDGGISNTQFYADIEGHPEQENVKLALEELGFFASIRVLGVYPQSSYRQKFR